MNGVGIGNIFRLKQVLVGAVAANPLYFEILVERKLLNIQGVEGIEFGYFNL